ncbi:hypothetical protein AVEN_240529-1 [Araneus ventricosus]|uniref:Uncharacterized protein n=1 Tax=Araneus ventricosus TaxID=182803 RepID=A0A4Y2L3I6_ARAVE|nr:hypothetical protein AVEN_240529-1 [Araneus ventricosus]
MFKEEFHVNALLLLNIQPLFKTNCSLLKPVIHERSMPRKPIHSTPKTIVNRETSENWHGVDRKVGCPSRLRFHCSCLGSFWSLKWFDGQDAVILFKFKRYLHYTQKDIYTIIQFRVAVSSFVVEYETLDFGGHLDGLAVNTEVEGAWEGCGSLRFTEEIREAGGSG